MIEIDADDHDILHAMRRATRIRWVNSRTVPYASVDSNDTEPGLETEPDRFVAGVACWDQDHDRPSPGDDITRAAFDAMDGAS